MRTHGFRTHALLALAAAVGVIAALGRPWYAAAPQPVEEDLNAIGKLHGPVDGLTNGIARWFSETAGATGWDSLGVVGTAIAAMAARDGGRCARLPDPGDPGRGARGAALRLACVLRPRAVEADRHARAPTQLLEPRYGAFLATAAALIALTSGTAVASAPLTRSRTVAKPYVPPAAPSRYETAGSAAPPQL